MRRSLPEETRFQWALVVVSYLAFAKLGLLLPFTHASQLAVWPPAGIALAAVILGGNRMLPAVAIAALTANLSTSTPVVAALGIASAQTLAAFAGSETLRRVGFRATLARMNDVVTFIVLGCMLSALVSVSIGVASLFAAGSLHSSQLGPTWRMWWLAVVCGDLLLGPAVLVMWRARAGRRRRTRRVQEALIYAPLAAVTVIVFRKVSVPVYVVFPMLFLPALLYRQRGAVIGSLIVAGISLWFSSHGHGPFSGLTASQGLLRAQTFVGVAALTALLAAAARSERRAAERVVRRLAKSERALEEAQHLAHIGSFDWDIQDNRTTWSPELYRIFGVTPEQYPNGYEAWRRCVHEEDRERVDRIVRKAVAESAPYSFTHRIVRPDGHTRTIECHGRVEVDREGGPPVRMVGTVQDVTPFKLAEDRFRGLLESAPDGMVILDEDGRVVLVNSQTERLFGYPRAELIGNSVDMLVPEQIMGSHPQRRDAFRRDPQPRSLGMGADLFARRKDGTEFPVEISLSPLETEDGVLLSAAVRDVTERKQAADALAYQASHDPLTGLPNRALFTDRLEHALARARRAQSKLAVLFIDLDDFKMVNDTLGHDAGDQLLRALTPRLNSALRPGDTVARFGGDEFVVLCEDLAEESDAIHIAERISAACSRPLPLEGREQGVSMSAGVVIVEGGETTPDDVLHDADAAMYRAKAIGKGRVEVFDERMRARLLERVAIEADLRRALEQDELRLLYQPVVSLSSGRIVGVESLLRWQHPERGLLEPGSFLRAAESGGLVSAIGKWVIDEACQQAATWRAQYPERAPLRVAVNLSARQVARREITHAVAHALSASFLDADLLELEVTEGALLEEHVGCTRALRELKLLGVRLVLDDFGTGYSSLNHLKRFAIDGLKIDRSFVEGLAPNSDDEATVKAVLGMAEALGVRVTAEGVETPDQLARLRSHGCAFAQGYLFSPPVTADELGSLLSENGNARQLARQ